MAVPKGVIFDFDGTLTELTLDFQVLRSEISGIVKQYMDVAQIAALEGQYIIEMIYDVESRIGARGEQFRKEAFGRLRELELSASEGKDVFPYTREVLGCLRRRGLKVGVISRSCTDVLRQVFPDIDQYVGGIVTRDHVREVKPHPGHVLAVTSLLSMEPGEGLMVGDHPTDIAAGKNVGMETVGLLTGRTAKPDFEAAGATYIFEDIRGLRILVD